MSKKKNSAFPENIRDFRLPRYHELPDMGLYLEQVTRYINGFLVPFGCPEMTSSMVSNYVKKGVIVAPVKKLYNAQQIAYLLVIGFAKSVLSLENIICLFEMQKKSYEPEIAYDYFCSEFENVLRYVCGLKDSIESVGKTDTEEKTMLRNVIIAASHSIYINNRFRELKQ